MSANRVRHVLGVGAILSLTSVLLSSSSAPAAVVGSSQPKLTVVAAENFWGSIAQQVGGSAVVVSSVVSNPDADPHEYEPTAADARLVAEATVVIENGIGYDAWMDRLLAGEGSSATVLNVGHTLRLADDANPHRWYNPGDVARVVTAMVADFSARDPRSAVVFRTNARTFERRDLATFNGLVRQIRARYHGVAVGASESIFAMLAPSLGLNLITPPTFLRAISEGSDVTASDVSTIDRQIAKHKIAIYVDNVQNATPDVAAQIALCRADHVPIATITETLVPQTATFELWQVNELRGILAALERSGVR